MSYSERPLWCEDRKCAPLCYMPTLGGGRCIGKLSKPIDHITKESNFMASCHYDVVSSYVTTFFTNQEDLIVDVYLAGEALRNQGLSLPSAIVDNLPKGG